MTNSEKANSREAGAAETRAARPAREARERVQAYLKRIGFEGGKEGIKLNFDTLHKLQRLHLQTIPYENLDIMRNIPLSLEPDDIFEKIVIRGRGGYCFELNGLITWLLRELGFPVTEYMARFLRDEKEIPMRRHRVLRVTCGVGTAGQQNYLADVGVGSMVPREPLPLISGRVSKQGYEKYKLEKEDFFGYVLYEWRYEQWSRLYSFTQEEQLNLDYIMPSYYCEKHPDSYFRSMDMAHLFTENGRKSVAGREVKIFTPGGVEVMNPVTEAAYEELLRMHFGIRL
jgi:N-hydroxyarylamine O-acetyltransferase